MVVADVALQPFTPDDDYCVYCHAPAAGPCAECGALCCGDCVEIVLQLSIPRAVCQTCFGARAQNGRPSLLRRTISALARLRDALLRR
jgi:hypothetical protein